MVGVRRGNDGVENLRTTSNTAAHRRRGKGKKRQQPGGLPIRVRERGRNPKQGNMKSLGGGGGGTKGKEEPSADLRSHLKAGVKASGGTWVRALCVRE